MAASAEEPVVAGSILEHAKKDAETLDWLSIPADQRIIDDKTLEWVADVPGLFGTDDKLEYEEKENMEPEPKRTKLENCSPVANVKDKRFMDLTGSPELASCSKGYVPPNTQANTQWSVKTFNSWMEWRVKAKPVDPVPKDILTCGDAKLLNKWLSLFVLEARKLDGTRYPTSTLNMLLCGLKRYMVKANPSTPNFLYNKDTRFFGLRGTLDTVARKLREDGVGSSVRHAAVFSYEEEESLWKAGTLGVESPKTLLNAIFYMNGKVLCLRGGCEHKSLKISQFNFDSDRGGDFVVYTENGSKNHSGTYKEKAGDNKLVKHYANTQLGNRCYVVSIYKSLHPKFWKTLTRSSIGNHGM